MRNAFVMQSEAALLSLYSRIWSLTTDLRTEVVAEVVQLTPSLDF